MSKIAKKKLLIGFAVIITVSLIFALLLSETPSEIPSASKSPEDVTVLAVGESTPVFKEVINELKDHGALVKTLDKLPDFTEYAPATPEEIDENTAVLFDGEWLEGNWENPELHNFLRVVVPKKCKLTSVGGATSNFFKALDKAGVFEIPVTETGEIRNPAYMDPPLVGYRVKVKEGSVGDEIFLAFGDDVMKALLEWLKN